MSRFREAVQTAAGFGQPGFSKGHRLGMILVLPLRAHTSGVG